MARVEGLKSAVAGQNSKHSLLTTAFWLTTAVVNTGAFFGQAHLTYNHPDADVVGMKITPPLAKAFGGGELATLGATAVGMVLTADGVAGEVIGGIFGCIANGFKPAP